VDPQDLGAAVAVGGLDGDPPIEPSGPQEGLIEDLRAVGRAEDDHVRVGLEPVHLSEDLVERLLALVVPAAEAADVARARPPHGVELVDEHDRRRCLLGLLEEVAHAGCADADDRLHELGGGEREERRVRLAGHRARQKGLAGPGRPVEEDAAGDARAERAVALRPLEEVDDLDQFVLGLVDARDIFEGDPVALAELEPARRRAPEAPQHAAGAAAAQLAPGEPDEEPDQQQCRQEAEQQRGPERPALVRGLGVDDHRLIGQQVGEARAIDERGNLGLEARHVDGFVVAGRVVARGLVELALDRIRLRGDLLDVARLQLADEEGLVGHALAIAGPAGHERDDEVHDEQAHEEREEAPVAPQRRSRGSAIAPLRGALWCCGRAGICQAAPTPPHIRNRGQGGDQGVHGRDGAVERAASTA
jgi:hypothetical protein